MDAPRSVPETLTRATVEMRGEPGAEWLKQLPTLIADLERRWSLETHPPFRGVSVNWVAPATRADGTPAVLKLSFPEDKEFETEAEALRLFGGRGIAQLLQLDLDRGAMLLERLVPGTPLSAVEDDEEATAIAAEVMGQLWRPAPPSGHPFPPVSDWARGLDRLRRRFGGGTGPLPAALVEEAEALFADLIPSQADLVLLHGDLHHENILAAQRRPWLAIDPKGVVGEPAYDTGAWLRNPMDLLDRLQLRRTLERRIEQLSEQLDLDRERVRGWGLSQAVLAAYWSLEDSGRVWEEALTLANLLSKGRV